MTESISFEDATVLQVHTATRRVARENRKSPKKSSPEVRAVAAALRKGPLASITVHVSGSRLTLGNIALDQLAALAGALKLIKLP